MLMVLQSIPMIQQPADIVLCSLGTQDIICTEPTIPMCERHSSNLLHAKPSPCLEHQNNVDALFIPRRRTFWSSWSVLCQYWSVIHVRKLCLLKEDVILNGYIGYLKLLWISDLITTYIYIYNLVSHTLTCLTSHTRILPVHIHHSLQLLLSTHTTHYF